MSESVSERQEYPPSYTAAMAPKPTASSAAAPPRYNTRPARQPQKMDSEAAWGFVVIFVYLTLLACQAIWIYYYVRISVNPNPRTGANITHARWTAFVAFMYIIGSLISMMNVALWGTIAWKALCYSCEHDGLLPIRLIVGMFVPLFALGMMIFPTFGGLIVLSPVQNNAWHHRCDNFRTQVVLDGRSYKDPRFVPDVARFYTGNGAAPLFTFDLDQPGADIWTFHLRQFDAPEESLPTALVPALRSISYDFVSSTLNGTCTDAAGNSTLCLTGSFNPFDFMSFDLSYNVSGSFVSGRSRTVDKQWSFSEDAPSLILRSVQPDGSAGDILLRTAVTKRSDCTQLKVCVDGPAAQGDAGAVGPEVLAPLGIMLSRQGDYSIECTTPDSS